MAALLSVADAKVLIGIASDDSSQDTRLTQLINAASEMIETFLRRKLAYGEHTDLAWQQGECLWLRAYPVEKIVSVTAAGDMVDPSLFTVHPDAGLIRRLDGKPWPDLPGGYTVVYTGGLNEIPVAIKHACVLLMQQIGSALENNGGVVASERLGDYSVTYVNGAASGSAGGGLDAFSPAVTALLRPYMGRRV